MVDFSKKLKGKANGDAAKDPSGLRAAGAKLAEDEKKAKAVQTRLDLGDERVEYQELEIEVPLSVSEAQLLERRATQQIAEADDEQKRLDQHMEATVAPWKAKIKELRSNASKDAADAKAHKRKLVQRTKVVYHPNTATVRFLHPDTGEDVMLSRAMTPKEMEDFDPPERQVTFPQEPVDPPPSTPTPAAEASS